MKEKNKKRKKDNQSENELIWFLSSFFFSDASVYLSNSKYTK